MYKTGTDGYLYKTVVSKLIARVYNFMFSTLF